MKQIPIGKKFVYKADGEVFLLRALRGTGKPVYYPCSGCGMINENCGNMDFDCQAESTDCHTIFKILKRKSYAK